jgi:hypothetical protein
VANLSAKENCSHGNQRQRDLSALHSAFGFGVTQDAFLLNRLFSLSDPFKNPLSSWQRVKRLQIDEVSPRTSALGDQDGALLLAQFIDDSCGVLFQRSNQFCFMALRMNRRSFT